MNIVLTGMMGSGKSTVGEKLAKKLDFNYIDTDEMIEEQVGKSINEIFKQAGEKKFRKLENDAVRCVALLNNYVIATGGGVVKNPDNMKELKQKGVIVYLKADISTLFERLKKKKDRPLLKVADPLKKLKNIFKDRKKLYTKADITVKTDDKDISEIVDRIIKKINGHRVDENSLKGEG